MRFRLLQMTLLCLSLSATLHAGSPEKDCPRKLGLYSQSHHWGFYTDRILAAALIVSDKKSPSGHRTVEGSLRQTNMSGLTRIGMPLLVTLLFHFGQPRDAAEVLKFVSLSYVVAYTIDFMMVTLGETFEPESESDTVSGREFWWDDEGESLHRILLGAPVYYLGQLVEVTSVVMDARDPYAPTIGVSLRDPVTNESFGVQPVESIDVGLSRHWSEYCRAGYRCLRRWFTRSESPELPLAQ